MLGGGLAGLVCARALASAGAHHGLEVEVWEATDRFGGKAGSSASTGRWVDHGFHVFPNWYANTHALLNELGSTLWHGKEFYEVLPREIRDDSRGAKIKFRVLSRTMVASLDLISRPAWYLDDLSVDGFLRARLYAGRHSGDRLREISRKALGSPAFLTSSLTMRHNLRWWMPVFREPNWNALRGPMQTTFIDPLAEATRRAGAKLCLRRAVAHLELRGGRILPVADGPWPPVEHDSIVVSALPVEVLKDLARRHPEIVEALIARQSKLLDLQYLEASPLSALDLHLTRRLRNLPEGHFILKHSAYDVTGLDITNIWPDYCADPTHGTVLQLVAGDTTSIRGLPDDEFAKAIIDDVRRFFDFDAPAIDAQHTVAMKHIDTPLFSNNVGTNSRRVIPTETGFENLYLIGDHTATEVDLACMEGAVYSALLAAQHICTNLGLPPPLLRPLRGVPRTVIVALKVLSYPLGWVALPFRLSDPYFWGRARREDQALRGASPAARAARRAVGVT